MANQICNTFKAPNGLDWRCRLTPAVQGQERGGWTPKWHGALTHQECRYKKWSL